MVYCSFLAVISISESNFIRWLLHLYMFWLYRLLNDIKTQSLVTFNTMSPTMYYQTKIVSELFLDKPYHDSSGTFRHASQMTHFWKFAEGPLIDGLYWDRWYNNESTPVEYSVLYENYLIGTPRLRQLRVRNDSCEVHKDFKRAISACYNSYASYYEDRTVCSFCSNSSLKSSVWKMFTKIVIK